MNQDMRPQLATIQSAAVYRRIATLFLALTAGVVLLAGYVVFARATVTVMSEQEAVKADFIVDIARQPGEGEVRGEVFELSDSATQTFPSTSVIAVDVPAEGRVKISSTLSRSQTLVFATRLTTSDDRLFRIRQTVIVPANGSVEVDAFAAEAGPKGEAPIGTTFTIPGLNPDSRRFFTVTAVKSFGGEKKDVRLVTQQDVDKAAGVLRERVGGELTVRMRTKAAEGLGLAADAIAETISLDETSRSTSVPVGSDAPEFSISVGIKAVGVFYDKAAFAAETRRRLADKLMDSRALVSIDESGSEQTIEKRDTVAGRANVHVTARGMSVMSAHAPGLDPTQLTGISVDAARAYVESLDGVASASIRARPFWAGRMPNAPERITIEVR